VAKHVEALNAMLLAMPSDAEPSGDDEESAI
jgi:hypothetical protein